MEFLAGHSALTDTKADRPRVSGTPGTCENLWCQHGRFWACFQMKKSKGPFPSYILFPVFHGLCYTVTPYSIPQINMESKLENEKHLPNLHLLGSMLICLLFHVLPSCCQTLSCSFDDVVLFVKASIWPDLLHHLSSSFSWLEGQFVSMCIKTLTPNLVKVQY